MGLGLTAVFASYHVVGSHSVVSLMKNKTDTLYLPIDINNVECVFFVWVIGWLVVRFGENRVVKLSVVDKNVRAKRVQFGNHGQIVYVAVFLHD